MDLSSLSRDASAASRTDPRTPWLVAGGLLLLCIMIATCWQTADRLTWFLETFPVMVVVPLLVATHRRYPLTTMLYALIFVHALVLIHGGLYTYAKAPLGFFMEHWLGTSRNPYDKVGHFFQGLVPALAAREILVRARYGLGTRMLAFLCVCIVMAVSACYELVEWGVAEASGQAADAFLGTQGDPWDTQSDMAFALIGGLCAMLFLRRLHDRQLAQLPGACPGRVASEV